MNQLFARFTEELASTHHLGPGAHVVIALSGGLDSVVLLELSLRAELKPVLAHVNYGLRGVESDEDETFVRSLARDHHLDIEVLDARRDEGIHGGTGNLQEEARKLRYQWLEEVRRLKNAVAIFTAHHQDDQVETIIHHFVRGAFIHGMTGMSPQQGHLIRPLLFASRLEIKAYAEQHKIAWREDSSNTSDNYKRNLIRHQVIPLLESVHEGFQHGVLRRAKLYREADAYLNQALDTDLNKLVKGDEEAMKISLDALKSHKAPRILMHRLLHGLGFTSGEIDAAADLVHATTGSKLQASDYTVWKEADTLVIEKSGDREDRIDMLIEDLPFDFDAGFRISIRRVEMKEVSFQTDNTVIFIQGDDLKFPLHLRSWSPGDRFIPFGMKNEKKVSDFLIHEKIPMRLKRSVCVLEDQQRILAIPGFRPDERSRILPDSRIAIRIDYLPLS